MPISRHYPSAEDAERAAAELRRAGYDHVTAAPDTGAGGTRLTVDAAFGTGALAVEIMDRFHPDQAGHAEISHWTGAHLHAHHDAHAGEYGTGDDNAAPLSAALGWKVLSHDPAPLSSALGWRTLSARQSPGDMSHGFPTLSHKAAPLSAMFGLPTLARAAAPLSSMLGLPTLSGKAAPLSGAAGVKTLSDDAAPLSRAVGMKTLSDNPAPLSSALGLPVLTKRQ